MREIAAVPGIGGTRRRWLVGALLALLIIVNYLDRGNLSIALPDIRRDLLLNNIQTGMILAAFQWTYAVANVPMGLVVDRFGPRRVILAAGVAWTLCAGFTGLAGSLAGLIAARACLGMAEAPMFPTGIKVVNSWFPSREKAMAVSMYEVAVQLGGAGAPLLGALLIVSLGWHLMFVAMASFSLIPLLIWFLFYRQPEDDPQLTVEEHLLITSEREDIRIEPPSFAEWWGLFGHFQTWAMICGGLSLAGMMGFYLWLPIYLEQARHFSLVHAGGSLSVFGLAGAAGVISGAGLSDLLIGRGWRVLTARRLVIVLGSLLSGTAIGCTALTQDNAGLLVALAAGIFATGLISAPFWALVPAVAPNDRLVASLGSLQNGGSFLGGAIAPLVIGWLLDHGFDFKTVLLACSGFALLTALVYGGILRSPIRQRA